MEFYATSVSDVEKFMYSDEQLRILRLVMKNHDAQLGCALDSLKQASDTLETKLTQPLVPVLDGIRSLQKFTRHFKTLSSQFLEELEKEHTKRSIKVI